MQCANQTANPGTFRTLRCLYHTDMAIGVCAFAEAMVNEGRLLGALNHGDV